MKLVIDTEALETVLRNAEAINDAGSLAAAEKAALIRIDRLRVAEDEIAARIAGRNAELAEVEKRLAEIRNAYTGPAPSARQGRVR